MIAELKFIFREKPDILFRGEILHGGHAVSELSAVIMAAEQAINQTSMRCHFDILSAPRNEGAMEKISEDIKTITKAEE